MNGGDRPLLILLRRFAATMAKSFAPNDVLYELCDATTEILDAAAAGVSVATDGGRLEFVTSTAQLVVEVEKVQQRLQQGPCVQAYQTGRAVVIPNIAEVEEWPEYRKAAKKAGLVAAAGIPLHLDDRRVGSLNVYDTRIRRWSAADLDAAGVIADVATAYLVRAGELQEAHRVTDQLQHALDSRITIEQAKGMLSRDHGISVDAAFALLRDHSRTHNVRLRELARRVVDDGLELSPRASD